MPPRTSLTRVFAVIALALVSAHAGAADPYPSRPIRLIAPYGTGGATDIVCRVIAQALSDSMGQQVFVDNRPGAGAVIGTSALAKSPPDGYTIMMADIAHGANVALHSKLPYDSVKDFAPVTLVALLPTVLLVHPSVPAHSVKELIALAKAKPGTLNFSSSGVGSSSHLAGELFKSATGTDMVHVPYKGGGESLSALLAGNVQGLFITLPAALPQIKAGTVRVLSVSSPKRLPALPDVPTLAEQGAAAAEVSLWMGILAPAGTPPDVVATLNTQIRRVLAQPAVSQRIAELGAETAGGTPEGFAEHIAGEVARWGRTIKPEMRVD
jgi:tripartite-type tricarboxylate transporter receptor subunit TctC